MKRRLRLMPEVLPDPKPPIVEGGPRQRAIKNMNRLIALATAGATMQAGCGTKEGDRPTDPTVTIPTIPTASDSGLSTPPVTPGTAATATATGTAALPPMGYGVVDPLPPPVRCPGIAATIKATAQWKQDRSGPVVEVKLPRPSRKDARYDPAQRPQVSGGKVIDFRAIADSIALSIQPDPGAGYLSLSVPVQCVDGESHVNTTLTLSSARTAGTAIPISLGDGW